MRLRFVPKVIGDSKTERLDGQVVAMAETQTVKQSPPEWNFPPVFDMIAEDGTTFVAFADELIIET